MELKYLHAIIMIMTLELRDRAVVDLRHTLTRANINFESHWYVSEPGNGMYANITSSKRRPQNINSLRSSIRISIEHLIRAHNKMTKLIFSSNELHAKKSHLSKSCVRNKLVAILTTMLLFWQQLRKVLLYNFYNISGPNFAILLNLSVTIEFLI